MIETKIVDNNFHARYMVKEKEYLYFLNMGEFNPCERNYVYQYNKKLANEIPFLEYAPKIYISAVTKQRLNQIFVEAENVYEQCTKRISTGLLNKVIKEAYMLNPPASSKGKRLKIMYVTQTGIQPPHIVIFANNSDLMKDHYKRYIENKLREAFGFFGTPVKLSIRERSDNKK